MFCNCGISSGCGADRKSTNPFAQSIHWLSMTRHATQLSMCTAHVHPWVSSQSCVRNEVL
eukprot:2294031-Amphidinium_carterae.1